MWKMGLLLFALLLARGNTKISGAREMVEVELEPVDLIKESDEAEQGKPLSFESIAPMSVIHNILQKLIVYWSYGNRQSSTIPQNDF